MNSTRLKRKDRYYNANEVNPENNFANKFLYSPDFELPDLTQHINKNIEVSPEAITPRLESKSSTSGGKTPMSSNAKSGAMIPILAIQTQFASFFMRISTFWMISRMMTTMG